MAEMSKAIRHVIEDHSGAERRLSGVDTSVLTDFVAIVGAFYADMREELERRGPPEISDREALAIADQHDIQTRLK